MTTHNNNCTQGRPVGVSMLITRSVAAILAASTLVPCMSSAAYAVDDSSRHFEINTQSLADALMEFGEQSGLTVVAPTTLTAGKKGAAVRGDLAPTVALGRLLTGSGLTFARAADDTIAIQAGPGNAPVQASTGGSTAAQDVPPENLVEELVVTGSRLNMSGGYQQPTPVTMVGLEMIQRENRTDLQSILAQLPAVGPASSPNTSNNTQNISAGTAGASFVNLRNLGTSRTLVLFDGQRVVSSSQDGGVDLNLLPASLVQRIDIVTGGASAAWGSDAVAGVVNVILNKKFDGWATHVEGASDEEGTRQTTKVELSYGTNVFADRGHMILSGSYLDSPDVVLPQEMSWYRSQNLVNNPAWTATNGQPRLIHSNYVGLSSATRGGLIASGPLRGTQFVEGGRPAPFVFGNVSGTLMNGGTFVSPVLNGQANNLSTPIRSGTLLAHFDYALADDVNASFQLNYGSVRARNGSTSYTRQGNLAISIENPYLDPSIVTQMQQLGITSFPLGTTNVGNLDFANGADGLEANGLANLNNESTRTLFRQVLGFDGSLFDRRWTWDIHLQHSEVSRVTHVRAAPIIANYNLAADPVRVTAGNVGTSGLPIGSIVCRSRLTTPGNGCVPLNVLGIGVSDPAAIAYVTMPNQRSELELEQYTASASIQGEPFSTWAGPVAFVMGAEYRKDAAKQTANPLAYARAYAAGNTLFFDLEDEVYEGFTEVNVPLLRDAGVQSVDFNAAGRMTDYKSSGGVETWKLGLTAQLTDDIRLRGTISADIRAPSLAELGNPGATSLQVISDPFRNGATSNFFSMATGNPNLDPEEAKTYSAGIVLSPRWLPGFYASVDYYQIDIKGAIVTPGFAYTLDQCFRGNQIFCPLIDRDSSGALTFIRNSPVNAASNKTSGFDFQADYQRDLLGGQISASVMGNYTEKLVSDALGVVIDSAGSLSQAPNAGTGTPKLRATYTVTYRRDGFSGSVQARQLGSAKLNNTWGPLDVDDNSVPAMTYWDLRGSYFLDNDQRAQVYLAVDNILDEDPPIIPNGPQAALSYFYVPTRTDIYDFLGRTYRVGARVKF